jgi:hypothetical protein
MTSVTQTRLCWRYEYPLRISTEAAEGLKRERNLARRCESWQSLQNELRERADRTECKRKAR